MIKTKKLLIPYAFILIGVLLFVHGFLLSKVELDTRSTCGDISPPPAATNSCWTPPHIARVVWIIIDALRYDFAAAPDGTSEPYLGRLSVYRDVLQHAGPTAAAVFRFRADPPTATMQRIKGLVTGGLPTFFDVSQSFASAVLQQDSIITQAATVGRGVVVMGDDTWMQLFPPEAGTFKSAYPFPSLVVHDLHTVDDGVWKHLLPSLAAPQDWQLLIAHYLGVDHVGHTYEVNSPVMLDKLDQMNAHVQEVVQYLVSQGHPGGAHHNTLLLVCGDHGQTLTGDHGGATSEETDTPLLAVNIGQYAMVNATYKPPLQQQHSSFPSHTMPQIDLAPTLSLLLGLPVPFSSIGKVDAALWRLATGCVEGKTLPVERRQACRAAYRAALHVNAWQVHRYVQAYAAAAKLPRGALERLATLYAAAVDKGAQGDARYEAFLTAVADFARVQWTQFHIPSIILGLFLVLIGVLWQAQQVLLSNSTTTTLLTNMLTTNMLTTNLLTTNMLTTNLLTTNMLTTNNHDTKDSVSPASFIVSTLQFCLLLLHGASLFSNSFILEEGRVLVFLSTTSLLLTVFALPEDAMQEEQERQQEAVVKGTWGKQQGLPIRTGDDAVPGFGAAVYRPDLTPSETPSANTHRDQQNLVILLLTAWPGWCMIALAVLLFVWGRDLHQATAHDNVPAGTRTPAAKKAPAKKTDNVQAAVYAIGWTLQGIVWGCVVLDSMPEVASAGSVAMGWVLGGQLGQVLHSPARVVLLASLPALCGALVLANLHTIQARSIHPRYKPPMSQHAHQITTACWHLLSLLTACYAVTLPISTRGTLLPAAVQLLCAVHLGTPSWHLCWLQGLMFYATGHYCEFAGLQYTAGFVGFPQGFNFVRCGLLLAINTLAPFAAAPLLGFLLPQCAPSATPRLRTLMLHRCWTAVCSCICAAMHRRHLMVWGIFAPKLLFELCWLWVHAAVALPLLLKLQVPCR